MKGYLTLEAALVMPVVLFIYMFIIYMAFYQYDRCVMEQDTYRCALNSARMWSWNNEQVYEEACRQVNGLSTERLVGITQLQYSAAAGRGETAVRAEGHMLFPFNVLTGGQGVARAWRITAEKKSTRLSPVDFIRDVRFLEEKIKEGQASNEDASYEDASEGGA